MDRPSPAAFLAPRATADALVWVVILIFLIRTFALDPYTIPTASMSPTFLGKHYALTCPTCRHALHIPATHPTEACPFCAAPLALHEEMLSSGDHVWVVKQPWYAPARYDAVALHSPDDPRRLVVKRIVGMPGEEVRIHNENIECRAPPEEEWHLPNKPAPVVREIAQLVFDDALRPQNVPPRWRAQRDGEWTYLEHGYERTGAAPARLRYRHLVEPPLGRDLILEAMVEPSSSFTSLSFGFENLDVAITITRQSTIFHHGEKKLGEIPFFLQPGLCQELAFAHVDGHLYFWVRREVLGTFEVPAGNEDGPAIPYLEVAGQGTKITDLVLRRDIIYRQTSKVGTRAAERTRDGSDPFLGDPSGNEVWRLGPDEYLALGDNPAASLDSRFWRRGPGVARRLIVGKVWRPDWIVTNDR